MASWQNAKEFWLSFIIFENSDMQPVAIKGGIYFKMYSNEKDLLYFYIRSSSIINLYVEFMLKWANNGHARLGKCPYSKQ